MLASPGTINDLSDYEKQRLQLIARNRAKLEALGIHTALQSLNALVPKKKERVVKPRVQKEPQAPSRQSSRLQGRPAPGPEEIINELAYFVINQECPRCGKVLTTSHKRHLDSCRGTRKMGKRPEGEEGEDELEGEDEEEEEDTEEAIAIKASRAAERTKRMDQKLKELELNGLVDFKPGEEAKFVVLGSTGNHYTITLTDDKQTCQCIDHRIRRHACKHIRLVLLQLGIADHPQDWSKAVEDKIASTPLPGSAEVQQDAEAGEANKQGSKRKGKSAGAGRPKKGKR